MHLMSPAFQSGGEIPAEYTADGPDRSPPLTWEVTPEGTRTLALIVDDPDAPDPAAPQMVWVHWVVYNLPPGAGGLKEGASPAGLPDGAREGKNDWRKAGWGGPSPPTGRHRYFFHLYALDTELPDLGLPNKKDLLKAMEGHVLEKAELMGRYRKAAHGAAR